MLFLSSLLINSSLASPVLVGKTIGLSKISQSYEISEELMDKLRNEYDFDVSLLAENPCSELDCQRNLAKESNPLWLVQIVISSDKKSAELTLYDVQKERVRNTKKVTGESWEEVRAKLPTSLLKLSKRRFSKIPAGTGNSESPEAVDGQTSEEVTADSNSEENGNQEATSVVPNVSLLGADSVPFEGFRARATGSLGVYRYNQSSENGKEHISPDVSLQTVIPDLRIMTEYWLASNQFGFQAEAAIAPFGYSLNGDNNIKTISNVRAGLAFHHPLGDKLSLEVGLAYHNTNGMDFRFEEERTKVDAFSQSITGGALSIGVVTRIANLDVRADISETFAPIPEQTRIRVYGERPLSTLSGNMMLTAHGGIQLTMRHFGFEVQTESGSVFDLQAGLFGGAGVSF